MSPACARHRSDPLMNPRKPLCLTLLVVLLAPLGCKRATNPSPSLEEVALQEFATKYWNPEIFDGECTGLAYIGTSPLNVYTPAPGYSADLVGLVSLTGLDMRAALMENGGIEKLRGLGTAEEGFGPIRIANYPFARASESATPKESWHPTDGYLLRFSNRVRFGDNIYLEIWIKGDRTSSGRRLDFKFDQSGRLVESRKLKNICDDWG